MNLDPCTLTGAHVVLAPLSLEHLDELCAVGLEAELWRWTSVEVHTREEMRSYVQTALDWQRAGTALPFATRERASGRVVGSTRFANIDKSHRRAEIGWTWVAPQWQRTAINTEAKFLMLRHAFEALGCIRVEFKTDALNLKSRAAILRIGAREEGTFRHHMIVPNGRIRDSVYFSIIDSEWPAVKAALQGKLAAQRATIAPGRRS